MQETSRKTDDSKANKIGIIGKLFGCWHKRLTRPFTNERVSYQACLECGARRNFDPRSFQTSNYFYFPDK